MPSSYKELSEEYGIEYDFYKENKTDKVWWLNNSDIKGEHVFSFDREKCYNLFEDCPHNLTKEEKEIFDAENPFWADFFKGRQ